MNSKVETWSEPLLAPSVDYDNVNLVSVQMVENIGQLEPYREAVNELAAVSAEPNVFYESWMLWPALRNYPQRQALRFILINFKASENARPILIGFFPLVEKSIFRGVPLQHFSTWDYSHCCLSSPLLHKHYVRDSWQALLTWFQEQRRCKLLDLKQQSARQPVLNELQDLLLVNDLRFSSRRYQRSFLVKPRAMPEYFSQAFSKRGRRGYQRRLRRLAECGEIKWETLSSEIEVTHWVEEFLRLEASGWKRRSGNAMVNSASDIAFLHEIVDAAYHRGQLLMLGLRFNKQFIAMDIVFLSQDGGFYFKCAYDEEFRHYGPGVMTLVRVIETITERGDVHWLDSCTAPDNSMSNQFLVDRKPLCNLLIAKPSSLSSLLVKIFPLLSRTKQWWLTGREKCLLKLPR